MLRVILTSQELLERGGEPACEKGVALFDEISALAGTPGVIDVEWTALADLWLSKAYPQFVHWLRIEGFIPNGVLRRVRADTDLNGACLRRCDLSEADLRCSELSCCDFEGAILKCALLLDATADHANFENASLYAASLSRANLQRADFSNARADLAYFIEADCRKAWFVCCSLREASFCRADLRGAIFDDAVLECVDFHGAMRDPTDRPIPGWRVENERMVRDV